MPYIKRESRSPLDKHVDPLLSYLQSLPKEEQDSALNYSITKILRKLYPKKYFDLNRALGVLTAITQELYRTYIGPYEDQKIQENGDVE